MSRRVLEQSKRLAINFTLLFETSRHVCQYGLQINWFDFSTELTFFHVIQKIKFLKFPIINENKTNKQVHMKIYGFNT